MNAFEKLKQQLEGKNNLFAIDTSGSVRYVDCALAVSMAEVAKKFSKVKMCFWDSDCSPIVDGLSETLGSYFNAQGKRGSSPACVYEKIAESGEHFDNVVLVTDGYFNIVPPKTDAASIMLYYELHDAAPEWTSLVLDLNEVYDQSRNRK